ncbi:BTB/POZ domain-containing protein KCTD6-like isoform X1 [Ptychodera flava]|uniref:BTB/POZ domain-containing protein KCTD6-like isoform X1 n=1 Tax=Ptychodera flava TaxID=63121 RepID=UPI00396AAECF
MGEDGLKESGRGTTESESAMAEVVNLNVGGHVYTTTLATLCMYPDSMLGAMFSGRIPTQKDSRGNYFIDRDGELFRYILNFVRSSRLGLPAGFQDWDALTIEADFFQIPELINALQELQNSRESKDEDIELHKTADYVEVIYQKHSTWGNSYKIYGSETTLKNLGVVADIIQSTPGRQWYHEVGGVQLRGDIDRAQLFHELSKLQFELKFTNIAHSLVSKDASLHAQSNLSNTLEKWTFCREKIS